MMFVSTIIRHNIIVNTLGTGFAINQMIGFNSLSFLNYNSGDSRECML